MVEVELPLRLVSLANERVHWAVKSKRARLQRQAAHLAVRHALIGNFALEPPMVICIERIGLRRLDDDNLAISAKHVRDGIADALGIDDGNSCLEWKYSQSTGKEYSVKITIQGRDEWDSKSV